MCTAFNLGTGELLFVWTSLLIVNSTLFGDIEFKTKTKFILFQSPMIPIKGPQ